MSKITPKFKIGDVVKDNIRTYTIIDIDYNNREYKVKYKHDGTTFTWYWHLCDDDKLVKYMDNPLWRKLEGMTDS